MGEARRKILSNKSIVSSEVRCVYCDGVPSTVEHMPPRSLFLKKSRPRGLEFACCPECNQGSSSADVVAGFVSRMSSSDDADTVMFKELYSLINMVDRKAPGVIKDLFGSSPPRKTWVRERSGLLTRKVAFRPNGPNLAKYLDVFYAKLAMALYREHVGHPLPLSGGVQTNWFLNAGLTQNTADAFLKFLPSSSTLTQGKFQVPDQFFYRYNCDDKSIFSALVSLHSNLHIFLVAGALLSPSSIRISKDGVGESFLRPGELLGHLRPSTTEKQNSN